MEIETMNENRWRELWTIPEDIAYLNHGSFGASPKPVQDEFIACSRRLESQPMNMFLREMEERFDTGLAVLADFLGTARNNLVYVDNATVGMNVVAESVDLEDGDEVLVTNHEYGAVTRLWRRKCQRAGAKLVTCELPFPLSDRHEIAERLISRVNDRTKLIVISHVTSLTAVELPVDLVCKAARERGVPVCIDGPHAVGMIPIDIKRLDCDFYTASCHKWLSSSFGSGFLFVHPRQQKHIQPAIVSWGGSLAGRQPSWKDEFHWLGTRNPAAFFSIETAIEFFKTPAASFDESCAPGISTHQLFREHSAKLVKIAIEGIQEITGLPAVECDSINNNLPMMACELPLLAETDLFRDPLMEGLWERHKIEIPIVSWNDRRLVRVSAHLYNSEADVQVLLDALRTELAEENASNRSD
jgi:isopenicillin-N epimerase